MAFTVLYIFFLNLQIVFLTRNWFQLNWKGWTRFWLSIFCHMFFFHFATTWDHVGDPFCLVVHKCVFAIKETFPSKMSHFVIKGISLRQFVQCWQKAGPSYFFIIYIFIHYFTLSVPIKSDGKSMFTHM